MEDDRDDESSLDARSSPSPYAEDFGAWVAEETGTEDSQPALDIRDPDS